MAGLCTGRKYRNEALPYFKVDDERGEAMGG